MERENLRRYKPSKDPINRYKSNRKGPGSERLTYFWLGGNTGPPPPPVILLEDQFNYGAPSPGTVPPNPALWTILNGLPVVDGSHLRENDVTGPPTDPVLYATNVLAAFFLLEFKLNRGGVATGGNQRIRLGNALPVYPYPGVADTEYIELEQVGPTMRFRTVTAAGIELTTLGAAGFQSRDVPISITWTPGAITLKRDGVVSATHTIRIPTTPMYLSMGGRLTAIAPPATVLYDFVKVTA